MNNNTHKAGGIGLLGVLTIVFIVLKLTHLIGWSWLWVLAPTWLPAALIILGGTIFFIVHISKKEKNNE